MDWPTFLDHVGYPVTVSAILIYGLWKFVTVYAWPLYIQWLEQSRADREKQLTQALLDKEQERIDRIAERALFLASLDKIVTSNSENTQKTVAALDALTKAVNRKRSMERARP